MSYKTIVSDWNGTLFEPPTDEELNKEIGYAILADAKKHWKIGKILGLLRAKKKLKRRLALYKQGTIPLSRVYEPFNENVVRGTSTDIMEVATCYFARENKDRIDGRILRPIETMKKGGKGTAILSSSYDYSIRRLLHESDFRYLFDDEDIIANILETDGDIAVGFTLDLHDNKTDRFRKEFFEKRGLKHEDIIYLGDGPQDDLVAEYLPRGNFIVPFFATDDFKQNMSGVHDAFIPENEEDLLNYLKKK